MGEIILSSFFVGLGGESECNVPAAGRRGKGLLVDIKMGGASGDANSDRLGLGFFWTLVSNSPSKSQDLMKFS